MLTKFEGFFYALTSHFPYIEEYETYEIDGCLSHYNFAFGRKSVDVFSETGIGSRFSALTLKTSTVMKTEILNTPVMPAPDINVAGNVKALTEQVNNLQSRYYGALDTDCKVRTYSDRWYFRAIGFTSFGLIFFPLLLVAAYCVYKAKICQKGDLL